jgi:hypothetical protein
MKLYSKIFKVGMCLLVPVLCMTTIGCDAEGTAKEVSQDVATELTVEEINADRGDACECINTALLKLNAFLEVMNDAEYSTSKSLNDGLSLTMSGCMTPKGQKEADRAWSAAISKCESFEEVREAMFQVRERAVVLKDLEQEEFVNQTKDSNGQGAAGILDRLRHGTQSN